MYVEKMQVSANLSDTNISVNLRYNDIRDICNACYKVHMQNMPIKKENKPLHEAYAKTKFLFDMVKHGYVQPETIEILNTLKEI